MSSQILRVLFGIHLVVLTVACDREPLNDPYPPQNPQTGVIYTSFAERPKHLDPAVAYSSDEYNFISQIYEPPLQYHYLKRPYELISQTAARLPQLSYLDAQGKPLPANAKPEQIAFTEYRIDIKPGIRFQPHPAFSRDAQGQFVYHQLSAQQLATIETLSDFADMQTRELRADDYVYQIKRLAYAKLHSPIAELMAGYIDGFAEFAEATAKQDIRQLKDQPMRGVDAVGDYQYRVRIKGQYPQFQFWLAMPFFAPMPWEADAFYAQPGLKAKNISLDWFPVGTGAFYLAENNPNKRMRLLRNPNFHDEYYPSAGDPGDAEAGWLADAGKRLPLVDEAVYTLEKETIPRWSKFLQGYYDTSGISSDSFDQAIQFNDVGDSQLTPPMRNLGIQLQTSVSASIFYMGFNMLDPLVGGDSERARKLRQAISIAVNYEEYIAIFANGRGLEAQGVLPPEIFGYLQGEQGINPLVFNWNGKKAERKLLADAQRLLAEAGYPNGVDPNTGKALMLYFDMAAAGSDDKSLTDWYRKQFEKLGIQLVIRATDYNPFQDKMRTGAEQLFVWGWNADYPDPENFFFLLYGPNGKVKFGGENASNYANPQFDALFEQMRNMPNGAERQRLIDLMQAIVREDAPWLFGYYPKDFVLFHGWYRNVKPAKLINNSLKYRRVDTPLRQQQQQLWNRPRFMPLLAGLALSVLVAIPAVWQYRRYMRRTRSGR
jgi:oligopeptide transport system substrate-binding protein